MGADELVGELRELTKKLLGYGARAPKELMLFVKNMMFLDASTASLAPDLDILGEVAHIYGYFQEHYGDQIALDLGLAPGEQIELDMDAVKAGMGLGEEWGDSLTYADVRERRDVIRRRMESRRRGSRARAAGARRGSRRAAASSRTISRCPSSRRCRRWPNG